MKVIGHRGAAGLALENTLESITAAKQAGVDAIEFDVRLTADDQFVLCHNSTTQQVSAKAVTISELTYGELSKVVLHNGESIPTLQQALKAAGTTPILIEVKGEAWASKLATFLNSRDTKKISVIAIDHKELARFHKLVPGVKTYAILKFHASELLEAIKFAARSGFTGVDMNFWLLNPYTYRLARQNKLTVIVYTVNYRWIARYLQRLFPEFIVTTDHPKRMEFLRK